MLTPTDQARLFALARGAIRAHLEGRAPPEPVRGGAFDAPRGVFVTLRKPNGDLRGCIGHARARLPLGESVRDLAVSAAARDHRFAPLALSELDPLHVELSVLSPLTKADPDTLTIGTHGLMIQLGQRSGLLLPQVASERGWTPQVFLQQTCLKAGLPQDAWRDAAAAVWWFTVDCYEEPA